MYYMPSNVAAALAATSIAIVLQSPAIAQTKGAEPASRAINDSFLRALPFNDKADFDDANRGFIATLPDGVIPGPGGKPAWDNNQYDFLKNEQVPPTVNPSLWRQAQLIAINGLFKVTDRVFQVRGLDISNMTIIEGDTGLILIVSRLLTQRDREGGARALSQAPAFQAGGGGDLHG